MAPELIRRLALAAFTARLSNPSLGAAAARHRCALKIFAPPLETKIGLGNSFGATWEVAPAGALWGLAGTGCVRCLVPILLFGGFGYAHL